MNETSAESVAAQSVDLYTDGACRGNPGPGGWGASLRFNGTRKDLHGGEPQTTNNRMELMAVIKGLQALKRPCQVNLYTDSKYVMDGATQWMHNWKKNNWKTAGKKPVKNVDLWQQLDKELSAHQVQWNWVKGHAGDEGNECADSLANLGIDELLVGN